MAEPDRASVTVLAPGKLNLALAVGPPRPDGMHPICSWMVTIDLHDELLVTRLPADWMSRYAILWHADALRPTNINWSITKDLAVRAHEALEREVGRKLPVQLKLEKRIPVGGGLGGGSADAAAMLHAVNALYELGLDGDALAAIGAQVGSDVAFLVYGGSAVVEGLGEQIERHENPPALHVVLVLPDYQCPTAPVYGMFDDDPSPELRGEPVRALVRAAYASATCAPAPDALFNELTAAAAGVAPDLARDLARVSELAERPAHLSGSGSCLFVVCDDPMHAQYLAEAIERDIGHAAVAARATTGPTVAAADPEQPRG